MKVIFLDIDGVLNFYNTDARAPSGVTGVVDRLVKYLASAVKETGAKIVLVSSWRHEWDKDPSKCGKDATYLNKKLERRGMYIMDKVSDEFRNREDAIEVWLKKNDHVTNWVIVDDDMYYYNTDKMFKRVILPNPDIGLTEEDANLIIRLLNTEDNDNEV